MWSYPHHVSTDLFLLRFSIFIGLFACILDALYLCVTIYMCATGAPYVHDERSYCFYDLHMI